MRASLNPDGTVTVDLFYDLRAIEITDKALMGFADRLACEDRVIKCVADQIIEGMTDAGSYGMTAGRAQAEPSTPLDIARRRVALAAGDVAKREIESLAGRVGALESELARTWDAAQTMRKEHPKAWDLFFALATKR